MTLYKAENFNGYQLILEKKFFFSEKRKKKLNCHCSNIKSFSWRKTVCYRFRAYANEYGLQMSLKSIG